MTAASTGIDPPSCGTQGLVTGLDSMATNLDLDLELRFALFEHIQRLRNNGGGLVTSSDLNLGLDFHGQRVPIWNQQQGIFTPAVLREFGIALTVQTSYKSPYDDRLDDDDRLVYKYRGQDPQHRDNRAMRRAFEMMRPLLYLVAVKPGVYEPVLPCYVVGDVPEQLAFLMVADSERYINPLVSDPANADPRKAYVTREVKQRLHQARFRTAVLTAYGEQCAMCRLRHVPLLEAAHILPDRDIRSLPEVPNGLSLCRIHHGAYDVGILGVDPDYVIHLRADILDEIDGPMLRHGLQEIHGIRLQTPRRRQDRPNPEFLAERFHRFQAA
jgi:putative restriction endonuclease